jgi:hypothetical protein
MVCMQRAMVLCNWMTKGFQFVRHGHTIHDGVWAHGDTLNISPTSKSAREIYRLPSGVSSLNAYMHCLRSNAVIPNKPIKQTILSDQ